MELIRKLPAEKNSKGKWISYGEFLCLFDNKIVKRILSNGKIAKSCVFQKGNIKHGGKDTKLYCVWISMKQRCLNQNSQAYKDYGGRGITICPEWTDRDNGFTNFRNWSLNNGYADNLEIHRENDGNYEPCSCKWVTRTENMRDTRKTITLEIANEIRTLYKTDNYTPKDLAEKYGIIRQIIYNILNNKSWKKELR